MTSDLRSRLQQSLEPAYAIDRELGGGGMSRVFLATEKALGRQVVIKVLPEELATVVSAERFQREIALAARLQHPHVVPVLSAGETSDRLPFFTMPFVAGESLRARLARDGELPVPEAVRILRDVASALAFAHGAGVVHRDIKPDNVLLAGGSAAVTDFGIAKALAAAGPSGERTSTGIALGTPAYMAPEQAAADPATDHRADVYAWGTLAYEVLTGQPPFTGRPPQALLAAHATETPEPIERRRPAVPSALAALVMRCLEKRPADRPQGAGEIVAALDGLSTPSGGTSPHPTKHPLRRLAVVIGIVAIAATTAWFTLRRTRAPTTAMTGPRSLAVLSFENGNADSTLDYFAEGLSDEIRSQLIGVAGLTVKARASSARFRGSKVDLAAAGQALQVATLLTGVVRRTEDRLHVTVDLAEPATGNALWSETFDGAARDLVAVRDSVTRQVVRALRLGLTTSPSRPAGGGTAATTHDFLAYESFLKGQYAANRLDFGRAVTLLGEAVARDPRFIQAQAVLAWSAAWLPAGGQVDHDSAMVIARAALARARALDSTLPAVYLAEAAIHQVEFEFVPADQSLGKAMAVEPQNALAHAMRGVLLEKLGRLTEALEQIRIALRSDPLDLVSNGEVPVLLYEQRRYPEALAAANALISQGVSLQDGSQYGNLGFMRLFLHQPDSAFAAFQRADAAVGGVGQLGSVDTRLQLMTGYAALGQWAPAQRIAAELERTRTNSPEFVRGTIHLVWGRYGEAVAAFERSVRRHEQLLIDQSLPCDPLYDPLKSDPRFGRLMASIGATMCPAAGEWPIPRPPAGAANQ